MTDDAKQSKQNEPLEPSAEAQSPDTPPTPDDAPDASATSGSAESAETGAESAQADEELQRLREVVAVREQELNAARENVLRAQAEMQNVHRRADQEIERARRFGIEKLVADLLPVADGLEQTIARVEAADSRQQAILDGVSITLKSLHDTLAKYGVEHVDPLGEPFDPDAHEAMAMLEKPDSEHNTVLEVYRKGYRLNGRLVRPAMVVVNRLPK